MLAELCMPFVRAGGLWVAAKGPGPEVSRAVGGTSGGGTAGGLGCPSCGIVGGRGGVHRGAERPLSLAQVQAQVQSSLTGSEGEWTRSADSAGPRRRVGGSPFKPPSNNKHFCSPPPLPLPRPTLRAPPLHPCFPNPDATPSCWHKRLVHHGRSELRIEPGPSCLHGLSFNTQQRAFFPLRQLRNPVRAPPRLPFPAAPPAPLRQDEVAAARNAIGQLAGKLLAVETVASFSQVGGWVGACVLTCGWAGACVLTCGWAGGRLRARHYPFLQDFSPFCWSLCGLHVI